MRRPKLRQMCGGGTWSRTDLRAVRRIDEPSGRAWIWDFAGWALVVGDEDWGSFWPLRVNRKLRDFLEDWASPWVYRAGYPDRVPGPVPFYNVAYDSEGHRQGRWLRVGPWVVGDLSTWDASDAP